MAHPAFYIEDHNDSMSESWETQGGYDWIWNAKAQESPRALPFELTMGGFFTFVWDLSYR